MPPPTIARVAAIAATRRRNRWRGTITRAWVSNVTNANSSSGRKLRTIPSTALRAPARGAPDIEALRSSTTQKAIGRGRADVVAGARNLSCNSTALSRLARMAS